MFRHVVMFRWDPATSAHDRDAAVEALRRFGQDIADLGTLSVGSDAGVSPGNFDVVVMVDLPDRDTYLRYARDPRHLSVVDRYIKPHAQARAAVQTELG
ncbi:MAG TPA: Dabb family protein [Mycobacteriales bacterium]|jgi:Stress responsive A/B Barrel Domain.